MSCTSFAILEGSNNDHLCALVANLRLEVCEALNVVCSYIRTQFVMLSCLHVCLGMSMRVCVCGDEKPRSAWQTSVIEPQRRTEDEGERKE